VHDALDVRGSRMIAEFWTVTFFAAVASDVLSGLIRYVTSVAGVAPLAYLPKFMMLACIVIIIVNRPKASHLLIAVFVAAEACVSLSNGQVPAAAGFWIWTMSPLAFAVMAPPQALDMLNGRTARLAFVVLGIVCASGVLVEYFVRLPWVGTSVSVGGMDIHVAANSYVGNGVRRLSGFGRGGSTTGLMVGLLATWLLPRFRSPVVASVMLIAAALAIWGTTNKTTLVSLVLVVALDRLGRVLSVRKACMWAAGAAVIMPLAAYATIFAHGMTTLKYGPLFSFEDRVYNTWPLMMQNLVKENLIWFGLGPGGFGAATTLYHGYFNFNVLYADNMALYVIASFGLAGLLLSGLLLAKLLVSQEPERSPVWVMFFFLLSSGVTTDIFESIGCLLFLGVTAKYLWVSEERSAWSSGPVYEAMPVRRNVATTMARRQ
jgi:hypothetical protein